MAQRTRPERPGRWHRLAHLLRRNRLRFVRAGGAEGQRLVLECEECGPHAKVGVTARSTETLSEAEGIAAELIDLLSPVTWDVTVWVERGNYLSGRLDLADQRRLIVAFLLALRGDEVDGK